MPIFAVYGQFNINAYVYNYRRRGLREKWRMNSLLWGWVEFSRMRMVI